MELGKTLYLVERSEWHAWLAKNHGKEKEIWLIYYRKSSGKPRIPYNDAVEEALCYGWIDSIIKGIDEEKFTQRFTPRKAGSRISEMNKERIRRLIEKGKMTPSGFAAIKHAFDINQKTAVAPDILKALRQDKDVWKNFQEFPESYRRIRVGWVEDSRTRPELFSQRLKYFLKMTAKNKKYGMIR